MGLALLIIIIVSVCFIPSKIDDCYYRILYREEETTKSPSEDDLIEKTIKSEPSIEEKESLTKDEADQAASSILLEINGDN